MLSVVGTLGLGIDDTCYTVSLHHMCIDIDMCIDMCIEMYKSMCIDMCIDMCIVMYNDTCMDMCIDM